jgi:hypothetical protein
LGRVQLMAQFARALPPVSLRVTDVTGPHVGRRLLLLHAVSDFFPPFHRPNPFLPIFLSLFRASPGYKNRMPHPSAPSYPEAKGPTSSRGGHARAAAVAVRHLELHTVYGSTSSSFPTLVSSPGSPLHPGVFLSRGNALSHEIAFSGNGATVGLAVAALFRSSTAVGWSDPIRSIHFVSNGWD